MIIITGVAGFIGSCLAAELNANGYNDLVFVDYFGLTEKAKNYRAKKHNHLIDRKALMQWIKGRENEVECIFHLGARTNTYETDENIFNQLNLEYSKNLWRYCSQEQIPFIYASSAATYGDGKLGFDDSHENIESLKPLNAYARSKQSFDLWALAQEEKPYFWAGLKFFNVFGPNEYHKDKMASVVYHAFNQIKEHQELNLFKSHKPEYADGMQLRDFIYVKDVVKILTFFMLNRQYSGIYNVGTGKARTFLDLGNAVFNAMEVEPKINFIDIPIEIRDAYQYFTEAQILKLRQAGYDAPFTSLEDGITDYVQNYLQPELYW